SSRRRHTRSDRDWSSDVCSSDLMISGELLPFKNAPFGLAIAAQVPVVPVYVGNTFEIMPKGRFFLRPRPIRLVIGEPISTAGMKIGRASCRERVWRWVGGGVGEE